MAIVQTHHYHHHLHHHHHHRHHHHCHHHCHQKEVGWLIMTMMMMKNSKVIMMLTITGIIQNKWYLRAVTTSRPAENEMRTMMKEEVLLSDFLFLMQTFRLGANILSCCRRWGGVKLQDVSLVPVEKLWNPSFLFEGVPYQENNIQRFSKSSRCKYRPIWKGVFTITFLDVLCQYHSMLAKSHH